MRTFLALLLLGAAALPLAAAAAPAKREKPRERFLPGVCGNGVCEAWAGERPVCGVRPPICHPNARWCPRFTCTGACGDCGYAP